MNWQLTKAVLMALTELSAFEKIRKDVRESGALIRLQDLSNSQDREIQVC